MQASLAEPEPQLAAAAPGGWKEFTGWLQTQLRRTIREYDWFEDSTYTEVEAEVEAELEGTGQRRQLKHVPSLQAALQQTKSRLVLVEGEPGAGKSVALRYLASSLLRDAENANGAPPLIPVYVNLRELKVSSPSVDVDTIKDEIRRQLSHGHPEWERFLERYFVAGLQEGRWLILLDSFDEIPEILSSPEPDDDVRRYAEAIHEFAFGMHQCRVIVASRPYRGPGRMPWPRFRILPLGEERRRRMVGSWFEEDDELAARILGELVAAPALTGWTSNPLLLSIVCAYRKAEERLPASAHIAFEGFVVRRIRDMQQALAERKLSPDYLRGWAERLAFSMAASSKVGLTPTRHWLREELAEAAPVDLDEILDCLIQLRFARGPRSSEPTNGFGFVHRRLQDYFATSFLLREQGEIDLTVLLTDESWRETTVSLLHVGAPAKQAAILDVAAELLEQHVAALRVERPELLEVPSDLPANHGAFNALRARLTPCEFPWPPRALHLLGIVGSVKPSASATATTQSAPVRVQADTLLQAAVAHGLRRDQAWALEVASAATPDMLERLLLWSLQTNSRWLEDIAFERAASLPKPSAGVAAGVRRLLVAREIRGKLRAEPAMVEAQVRRLDSSGRFLDSFRLLQTVRSVDTCALALMAVCMVAASALSGATNALLVAMVPAAVCGAVLLYLLTSFLNLEWMGPIGAPGRLRPKLSIARRLLDVSPLDTEANVLYEAWYAAFVGFLLRGALAFWLCASISESIPNQPLSAYWVYGSGLVLLLALLYRPAAYYAVQRGRFAERWTWPLLGNAIWLAVVEALFGPAWRRAWFVASVMTAYIYLMPMAIEAGSRFESLGWLGKAWPVFSSVVTVLACTYLVVAECRDRLRGRLLRARLASVELEQMLRNVSGFWRQRLRLQYLRWARENGKLRPTLHGQRMLRELLIAIERDYAGVLRSAPSSSVDAGWSSEFAAVYRELAHPKRGLAGWHGEIPDELSRLAEQLQLRVRDQSERSS